MPILQVNLFSYFQKLQNPLFELFGIFYFHFEFSENRFLFRNSAVYSPYLVAYSVYSVVYSVYFVAY